MTPLRRALAERREQFDTHFALARAMEDRIFEGQIVSIGETELTIRHLMTMKSGLVVHLYNAVEATMAEVMQTVGLAIGGVPPTEWTDTALKEWLRKHAAVLSEGGEEGRLNIAHSAARNLLGIVSSDARSLKKPSGTWTDELVYTLAKRLDVRIRLPPDLYRRLRKRADLRDLTPLGFVADRRNAIAHGRRSFEDGAKEITLVRIRELADATFDFLDPVVGAFEDYVAREGFRMARA